MCSELTNCGHLNPFYADACKVKATPGYTYLVHIVNSCMNFGLYFALANHSLVLVRTDSGYVQPFMVDVVIVQPGQSVDVLVTANHTSGKFYMAATPFSVAPYSTVSSQILHHDAFYPLQI
jgi:FtsP/CotA-like multicopper oxidase with cupredoxin domain